MIRLANTDLTIYPLCLGGNVFGYSADKDNSEAVLTFYADNGGNFIDTADMYSQWAPGHIGGESETIIGNWMKKRGNRSQMIIATKVGRLDTKPGLSPSNIISACEDSLKRLGSDYIDIYYSHLDDLDTPIEQSLGAYDSLIKSGKVRYIAASNFTPERLQESLDISKELNLASYIASQDQYNLMEREYESTLRDVLEKNNLSQIPFFGLARGFLTCKYRCDLAFPRANAAVREHRGRASHAGAAHRGGRQFAAQGGPGSGPGRTRHAAPGRPGPRGDRDLRGRRSAATLTGAPPPVPAQPALDAGWEYLARRAVGSPWQTRSPWL